MCVEQGYSNIYKCVFVNMCNNRIHNKGISNISRITHMKNCFDNGDNPKPDS